MFTGIVDHCGKVGGIEPIDGGKRIRFFTQYTDLSLGESVSVRGACLTVTDSGPGWFSVDISTETIKKTADYIVGAAVNMERSLRMGDRMGGHWVTGHVDESTLVLAAEPVGECCELRIGSLRLELLVSKGSICVDGVSLTINTTDRSGFSVMLIPHTLERTTLKELTPGARVNLEYDFMAKMVVNQMEIWKGAVCG